LIKVLVVDDHEIIRKGLSLVFELEDEFELAGEARDGDEALKQVAAVRPDVVLMDIKMPRKNGLQAAKEIKEAFGETKIIVLTALEREEDILIALQIGVDGYILKNADTQELAHAVREVAAGRSYLHPAVARRVIGKLGPRQGKEACARALTPREALVLRLMADGQKNKEIAARLFLSEETVKSHVSHILAKLEQTDRIQAVLYALRHNLVSLKQD
jgi:DNA-binding NarL/FixJ family response regulator